MDKNSIKSNKASGDLLVKALNATSCALTVADANEKDIPLIYVNDTFERITGYKFSEAVGRNCRFLQGDDRSQPGVKKIRKALQAQKEVTAVIRNYRKNGELFWNQLLIAPVFDEQKKLTHFIGVQTDVTEKVEAEEKLKEYKSYLEELVEKRTRELNEKNIALTELVSQIGMEKQKLQDQMISNIDQIILPTLRKVKENPQKTNNKLLDSLEENLLEITSEFGMQLNRKAFNLSPREIEICNLIRQGLSSKDIASTFNVSLSTIENQRNVIRKKLKISQKKVNLTTFLKSMRAK